MAEDEEEVTSGLLPFTVDGTVRLVPELKWRANREWCAQMQRTFVRLMDVNADTPEGLAAMADAERELVLAYDVSGALGDLEDATEREVDAIYNRLLEVAFPLAESQTAVMVAIFRAAASAQENSTSSPSPSGISAPTPLRRRSPSARSRSTTARRASA
jgi:hypothetical protein